MMHASVACDQGSGLRFYGIPCGIILSKSLEELILTEKQMKLKACG
jgi:hypothetical protein